MSKAEREKAIEVFENSIKCHEQQKKHICDRKCGRCHVSRTYTIEEVEKAIDTAIEALSEESKLDKIVAEIKGIKYLSCPQPEVVLNDVLDIINKYREVEE